MYFVLWCSPQWSRSDGAIPGCHILQHLSVEHNKGQGDLGTGGLHVAKVIAKKMHTQMNAQTLAQITMYVPYQTAQKSSYLL